MTLQGEQVLLLRKYYAEQLMQLFEMLQALQLEMLHWMHTVTLKELVK